VAFSLRAPEDQGEYEFSVMGKVSGCTSKVCSKIIYGRLVVSDTQENLTGFSLRMFPESMGTKGLETVVFRYTIANNQNESRAFAVSMQADPTGAGSTFEEGTVEVPGWETRTKSFRFTPSQSQKLYKITVKATSGQEEQSFTSFLTTDELLSDLEREKSQVWSGLSAEDQATVGDDMLDWKQSYSSSSYLEAANGASQLKETLDAARVETGQGSGNGTFDIEDYREQYESSQGNSTGTGKGLDMTFIIIIAAVLGVVALLLVILLKRRSGKDVEFQEVKF
jgi:hypothetical protein